MDRISAILNDERDRWILWTPVFFGLGIGAYFSLPAEPHFAVGGGAVAVMALILTMLRALGLRRWAGYAAAWIALLIAAGLCAAQWRTLAIDTQMLEKRIGPTSLGGKISRLESFPDGARLTIVRPRVGALAPHRTPETVRVRLRGKQPAIRPGDWIRLRAVLSPPPPPAAPRTFDFQRSSYFKGIGAIGFAVGPAEIAERRGDGAFHPAVWLAQWRSQITARIIAALPPPQDGVAAALMTGERSAVPASILDSMRDSGLAHLLAISGLHIGLVAGILFAAVRAGLVMVPGVALRYPVKKWAAVAAIAGAFIYALIAGATLPTQRAFLMIALALLGVILDRRGLSLRSVAWAALVILALQPESLLGASFQMSFAAVVALVAAYEYLTQRRRRLGREAGPRRWHQTLGRYLIGIAITSLVAGAATAPFAVYHFNRFADYGLVANMLAVPLTGFWVMPWAIIGFVLMPFGAEAVGLVPMGWGIAAVVAVAETVAGWPGAVTLLPAMPIWGLAAIALGGLWLCIWRYRWRVWGAAGLATIFTMQPPDILVDGGGRVLAVRGADGGLIASTVRRARFQQEIWARLGGDEDQPRLLPTAGRAGEGAISCDAEGCLYRRNGRIAALIRQESAATEDCWTADVVIALVPLRRRCPAAHVIDRFDLWRSGSHAVWMTGVKVRVETVDGYRGRRPWVVGPAARRDGTGGAS